MKKNQKSLITLAILMAASPLYATPVPESEDNGGINIANYVNSTPDISATIGGVGMTYMFPSTDDVDFYSFYANAGDDITVDIDYGIGGQQDVDTLIGLFDSNRVMVDTNDDTNTLDSGSTDLRDARIDHYIAQTSGTYYVGVSSDHRQFTDGGLDPNYNYLAMGGDYELIITKVSPVATSSTPTTSTTTISSTTGTTTVLSAPTAAVIPAPSAQVNTAPTTQHIDLEIRPGSRDFTPINPNANGVIPVALLSKKGFSAMDIDPASITFGAKGTESSLSRCNPHGQDVNGDGLPDMLCFFSNQAARFKVDSLQGFVRGKTRSGTSFEGHGITKVKIVPAKTKNH